MLIYPAVYYTVEQICTIYAEGVKNKGKLKKKTSGERNYKIGFENSNWIHFLASQRKMESFINMSGHIWYYICSNVSIHCLIYD